MHIVELSTAAVEVDIKVIAASLTQNQCLQCVTPPLTHVEIPQPSDANELHNDGMSKRSGAWKSVGCRTAFAWRPVSRPAKYTTLAESSYNRAEI